MAIYDGLGGHVTPVLCSIMKKVVLKRGYLVRPFRKRWKQGRVEFGPRHRRFSWAISEHAGSGQNPEEAVKMGLPRFIKTHVQIEDLHS